jgi:hypothetical protein
MYEERKEAKQAKKAQGERTGPMDSFFPPKQKQVRKKTSPDSTSSKHDHSTAPASVRKLSNGSSSKSTITNLF